MKDASVRLPISAAAFALRLRRCFIYASPPRPSSISGPPARRAPAHPRCAGAPDLPRESAQPMAESCPSSAEARSKLRLLHPATEVGSRTGCIACRRRAAPYRRGDERDGPHGPNASPRPERLLCELSYKRLESGRFHLPRIEPGAKEIRLDGTALTMLLDGIDLRHVRRPTHWEPPGGPLAAE